MPDKRTLMRRAGGAPNAHRPVMLGIAGDSAAGKTTLTRGLVDAIESDDVSAICVDDYHRYDRDERKHLQITPLNPACNYVDIMEQHLQLLAMGEPILKPVYDHHEGRFTRPLLVEPADHVIVEGLLPLHTRLSRACFDLSVYLDLPEEIRRAWKVARDTRDRGYAEEQVLEELDRREPDSAAFIRPQREFADIVVRFAPIEERGEAERSLLSATILLRPTAPHPDLTSVLNADTREAIHLKLARDSGKPVDALHVHAYASRDTTRLVEEAIWEEFGMDQALPESLGEIEPGVRSEPLAIVQLILLHDLLLARRVHGGDLNAAHEGAR